MFSVDVSFFLSPPGRQRGWSLSVSVSDVADTSQASCFYYMSLLPSGPTPPTAFFLKKYYQRRDS